MKKEKVVFVMALITIIISSIISVYAANYLYNSNEVEYDNTNKNISSTNVQGAIDELYTQANDYTELKNKIGTESLTTTSQTLTGAINELKSTTNVQVIDTGITNVYAHKYGKIVFLVINGKIISTTSVGWYTLGALPESLRPCRNFRTALLDNHSASFSDSMVIHAEIQSDGEFRVYAYPDLHNMNIYGMVTYITCN